MPPLCGIHNQIDFQNRLVHEVPPLTRVSRPDIEQSNRRAPRKPYSLSANSIFLPCFRGHRLCSASVFPLLLSRTPLGSPYIKRITKRNQTPAGCRRACRVWARRRMNGHFGPSKQQQQLFSNFCLPGLFSLPSIQATPRHYL